MKPPAFACLLTLSARLSLSGCLSANTRPLNTQKIELVRDSQFLINESKRLFALLNGG